MRVAITGGIAEGKSTVLGYLASMGHSTLSSDRVAEDLYSDSYIQQQLAGLLGIEVPVSRESARNAILAQPELRLGLNRLLHPHIANIILSGISEFTEVPLLLETCLQGRFDSIWVVTCGGTEQMRRLIARLGDEEEAGRLVQIQIPTEVKTKYANQVIRTNAGEDTVKASVAAALSVELAALAT
ncbi:MAG: dephospho-CoA kinase [Fimbriimonadaceae bacterium]